MKDRYRIFIAINLPEEVKEELAGYRNNWLGLPAKLTKKENFHITVDFLGNISAEKLITIFKNTEKLASSLNSFKIVLNRICYGPLNKTPKMIWATGPKIEKLNLVPHITLARIRKWDWQKIEPEERPVIDEEIEISFEVNSIEIMESVLKKKGPEYIVLESIRLS